MDLGLIQGRFRADPYKNFMVVLTKLRPFFVGVRIKNGRSTICGPI